MAFSRDARGTRRAAEDSSSVSACIVPSRILERARAIPPSLTRTYNWRCRNFRQIDTAATRSGPINGNGNTWIRYFLHRTDHADDTLLDKEDNRYLRCHWSDGGSSQETVILCASDTCEHTLPRISALSYRLFPSR